MEKIVLIGASTGGPGHLKELFYSLPKSISSPIIVAQHMGKLFIPSFIEQFRSELQIDVKGISEDTKLDTNGLYICEENAVLSRSSGLYAKPQKEPKTLYNPSVNTLFNSAVSLCKSYEVMAILLTGIGDDGAKGLLELSKAGAYTIGESEESAVVYGMPKKAKELNPNLKVLSLKDIKNELQRFLDVLS